jgi:hypothetical protein
MKHNHDERIQGLLDLWFSSSACSWCKEHNRPLYGKKLPLCGSCKRIAAQIRKHEKLAAPYAHQPRHLWNPYRSELETAQKMKSDALADGRAYADLNTRDIDGLELEHLFNELGRISVHKELFYNDATMLAHSFSMPQRRLLVALLSRIVRERRRKTRKPRARWTLDEE